jgi:hypothetical protein
MFRLSLWAVALVSLAQAKDIVVTLGQDQRLIFNPGNVVSALLFPIFTCSLNFQAADIGDTITFTFLSGNHSIGESSFETPCVRNTPFGTGL